MDAGFADCGGTHPRRFGGSVRQAAQHLSGTDAARVRPLGYPGNGSGDVPVNVEIKARVGDPGALRERVLALSEGASQRLRQNDTFFEVPAGRLKLRVIDERQGELICYRRSDERGPTPSAYQISRVDDPDALQRVLSTALGVRGVVRKEREVFLVGRTRVHLDRVEGLGSFLELEVVLAPGEPVERGHAEAQDLLDALRVHPEDLERSAYVDLLETGSGHRPLPSTG